MLMTSNWIYFQLKIWQTAQHSQPITMYITKTAFKFAYKIATESTDNKVSLGQRTSKQRTSKCLKMNLKTRYRL